MVVVVVLSMAALPSPVAAKRKPIVIKTVNATMVTTLKKLKRATLGLTTSLVSPASSCELSTQIQVADTCSTVTCAPLSKAPGF